MLVESLRVLGDPPKPTVCTGSTRFLTSTSLAFSFKTNDASVGSFIQRSSHLDLLKAKVQKTPLAPSVTLALRRAPRLRLAQSNSHLGSLCGSRILAIDASLMMNRVPLFDLAALEAGRSDAGQASEDGNGSCAEKVPVLRNGYCWAGDPKLESPRRTHSTSSLEQYFNRYSFSSGTSTPRASPSNAVSTPTPNSSYYTSFTNTTPTQDDVESVEDVLTDNFAGRVRPMVY
ncbi:hypothetical protein L204_104892 [Cryptococcus depauperatus]